MAITRVTIKKNYQRILNILDEESGAKFVKVDLHVHTPGSGDAQSKNKYNYKFNMKDIPASLESAKHKAAEIVDEAVQKGIRVLAITDHNSPSIPHPEYLADTWYQLLKNASVGKSLTVLPGVEISTDDLHILVILNPKEGEPATYITHRINFLMQDCGFTLAEYGDYKATGTSSLADVLQHIENLGTHCIVIPAHIDIGKKAMLTIYKKPSNIYRKLLNHPNLNVIEVVKDTTPTNKKIGKESVNDYFNRIRSDNRSRIAFVQNSDGHSISEIGKRFTYVRMGKPDFWSLRNALENPETRVRLAGNYKPDEDKTRIIGITFSTGDKWNSIAFNVNLNCIVGKRRTKKTTIVDLILYGLDRFADEDKTEEAALIKEGYLVNVFIAKGPDVFCYSRNKDGSSPKIYRHRDNLFTPTEIKPDIELPRKYNHQIIEKLFSQSTELMDFLDRHVFANKEMQPYLDDRNKHLQIVKDKNFENCASEMEQLSRACKKLFDERQKHIEPTLEEYGRNLFKVKVAKGEWKGTREQNFFDKANISMLYDSEHKPLLRLTTGERNAAMMVLLMNQKAFGPLIIDEPEQYLDIKSITGMLIPRIRLLKTRQQIICVTRDEHILISGDAEQVIVTMSEEKLQVVTGEINDKKIQQHIIEIFEGDKFALLEKSRKLQRILE